MEGSKIVKHGSPTDVQEAPVTVWPAIVRMGAHSVAELAAAAAEVLDPGVGLAPEAEDATDAAEPEGAGEDAAAAEGGDGPDAKAAALEYETKVITPKGDEGAKPKHGSSFLAPR